MRNAKSQGDPFQHQKKTNMNTTTRNIELTRKIEPRNINEERDSERHSENARPENNEQRGTTQGGKPSALWMARNGNHFRGTVTEQNTATGIRIVGSARRLLHVREPPRYVRDTCPKARVGFMAEQIREVKDWRNCGHTGGEGGSRNRWDKTKNIT